MFDGKVIAGTRAKKVRTKSYNAFSSIDFPYLAVIQDRRILRYLPMLPYEKPVRFYEKLSDSVFLLKINPWYSAGASSGNFRTLRCDYRGEFWRRWDSVQYQGYVL